MHPVTVPLEELKAAEAFVATAESLTGGQLATRFTDSPGSSSYFLGGVVTYATALKIRLLGVPEALIEEHGVVSAQCAQEMAVRVRELTEATYGLATTGVAGPDEQEGKPVGTVYVAVAGPQGVVVRRLELDGSRSGIQERSCDAVLELLAEQLPATPAE